MYRTPNLCWYTMAFKSLYIFKCKNNTWSKIFLSYQIIKYDFVHDQLFNLHKIWSHDISNSYLYGIVYCLLKTQVAKPLIVVMVHSIVNFNSIQNYDFDIKDQTKENLSVYLYAKLRDALWSKMDVWLPQSTQQWQIIQNKTYKTQGCAVSISFGITMMNSCWRILSLKNITEIYQWIWVSGIYNKCLSKKQ